MSTDPHSPTPGSSGSSGASPSGSSAGSPSPSSAGSTPGSSDAAPSGSPLGSAGPTPSSPGPSDPTAGGAAPPPVGGAAAARRSVASYALHQDAVRAVDWLSDEGFPVERVAIVGSGLKAVQQVTGRLTTGRAAGQGAAQGAVIGVLFALLFGIFFAGPAFFGLLVYSVVLAALLGAALGALSHAALGGTQDFGSISTMTADRYDVMVDQDVADEAERLLGRLPAGR